MEKLITTVRERYGKLVSFRGLATLAYRENGRVLRNGDTEQIGKRGFSSMLSPQLQGISKKLHDEVNQIIQRRDKLLMQTMTREIPKIIGHNTAQLKSDRLKSEKTQAERTGHLQKRVDLFTTGTGTKLDSIRRDLERLKAAEKIRTREEAKRAEEQPVVERRAQKLLNREAERGREELRREIDGDIVNTERRITRKLRDVEEYEKRRRG